MGEQDSDFGEFGTVKPVGRRPFIIMRAMKILSVIVLLAFLPTAIHGWNEFYNNLAEQDPPTIRWIKPPVGLGREPAEIRIEIADRQSGLDEVIVRCEQNGEVRTLLTKSYPAKLNEDLIQLTVDAREIQLREGQARIDITVFDRSFWSSRTKSSLELNIDFRPPGIEVLSTQHNAVRTGVELVFYRLLGDPDAFSGVTAGEHLFPGFAARKLDPAFEKTPDVHFALFAIPRNFDAKEGSIRVIARDSVGNSTSNSIFYRVREIPANTTTHAVAPEFMQSTVDRFYKNYLETRTKLRGGAPVEFVPAIRAEERLERFQTVNEEFRALVEEAAKPLFLRPKSERFWSGKFGIPGGRRLAPASGELQEFVFEGTPIGRFRNEGMYFGMAKGAEVRAANEGVVIFADELGTYGRTLILDHGFGLTSIYYNLDHISFVEGDRVGKGEVVGTAGATAFLGGEKVGFEMRLNGMPIRLEEWWDERWIRSHFWGKINATKRKLGLEIRTALE